MGDMSARKPPLLLRGGLTGRVYVVTSYTEEGEGRYIARTKFDVTDQYNALRAEDEISTTSAPASGGAS